MRVSKAIRAGAWALVAAGVIAPVLRRRAKLPSPLVLAAGMASVPALAVAVPRSRTRDMGICALNMWAYLAAYKMPNDHPECLRARVRVGYPIAADRIIGLGVPPTIRLQALADRARIGRLERALVWSHWVWFAVPHSTLAFILWRAPERFPFAAARMYAVFDIGAVLYWAVPTAPPWYASEQGSLRHDPLPQVRRKMIDYGQDFWGERWGDLYDVLGGNPLAAMPSLHFATSVMGARLLGELSPLAGAIGWAYAATLGVALVYLGEHYVIDLVAGGALAATVCTQAWHAEPTLRGLSRALQALERRAVAG
ncbi:MAG: phosphatase PAP2 family protein [Solirubrobacteraceae bacterium]